MQPPERDRYDRLHAGIRTDPESIWPDLRAYLCDPRRDAHDPSLVDLVEDLMFWHAAAFVGRVEALVDACPSLRETVALAHVDGTAAAGVDRFRALQERLLRDLSNNEPG